MRIAVVQAAERSVALAAGDLPKLVLALGAKFGFAVAVVDADVRQVLGCAPGCFVAKRSDDCLG